MTHPDDAAVYRMPGGDLLVQTIDVIAPIVDDPANFGRIACANALSDVYAMGGKPLTALNVACFPSRTLPLEILRETMHGANELLAQAGCDLVGGHTVNDPEFKFGYAVSGVIEGGEPLSIDGARVGEVLVLTKPLGTGIVNQALRKGKISNTSDVYLHAQRSMLALNKTAGYAARAASASACTDVTGFGLLGHAAQFARASQVTMHIHRRALPVFDDVLDLIADGMIPSRVRGNAARFQAGVTGIQSNDHGALLYDPQTSGGLLVTLPEERLQTFFDVMNDWPHGVVVIGRVGLRRAYDVIVE